MGTRSLFAKTRQTPVSFPVPANACDCHTHIFGDPRRFPFVDGRGYTPGTAPPAEMAALHRGLHMKRVVIVTPSVYGTSNSATLWGMKARGPNARGIAVIDDRTTDAGLAAMDLAGIRGVRINLGSAGAVDRNVARLRFQATAKRVAKLKWHVQVYAHVSVVAGIRDQVEASGVPVVFDHFGGAQAADGLNQPGFADLLELVRNGAAYVKISGAYRASPRSPDYPDTAPFAKALIAANPDRIVWGTDWPHPDSAIVPGRKPTDNAPFLPIDDGRLLNQLPVWAPDAAIRDKILVANPARLYGFA